MSDGRYEVLILLAYVSMHCYIEGGSMDASDLMWNVVNEKDWEMTSDESSCMHN